MKRIILIVSSILVFYSFGFAYHYQNDPNIYVTHYKFEITLSDTTNRIFCSADVTIKFVKDSTRNFSLDLVGPRGNATGMLVSSVEEGKTKLSFIQSDEKLKVSLRKIENKGNKKIFKIDYSGIPADGLIISKNKFGQKTFFGDNWPNRAHNWLPTVDYPTDKATCEFIIIAPSEYQVVANGSLVEETNLRNSMKLTHWKEDVPIPTKIMVFGAARFAVQYVGKVNCVPVETWVYPQDREKGFYDFSVAKNILQMYEKYLGSFPYEKLANVESTTKYGGMENASNIFYDEFEVTGTGLNESTVAHEIAHQWFGDSVTEGNWYNIWLSEGFATFFQNFYVGKTFGQDSLMNVLRQDKKRIFSYYYRNPEPILDTTITNLNNLLNVNSYFKGAYVLRMLRHLLGEEKFWKGIRLYYNTYKNKNALTPNFEKCMEKASNENLNWFFKEWVYEPGFMNLELKWNYSERAKKLTVSIKQKNKVFKMPVDLGIYLPNKNNPEIKRLNINRDKNDFTFSIFEKPKRIEIDPYQYDLIKVEK